MTRWRLIAAWVVFALALSACNSTESVMERSSAPQSSGAVGNSVDPGLAGTAAAGEAAGMPASPASPAPAGTLNAQAAALASTARVQFAPIVGATVEAVTPLTRRLSERAAQRGIILMSSGTTGSTHLMKGYFSAFTESGDTTVIYVWDVFDPSGSSRLHRIQGQAKAEKVAEPGWPGVPASTMEAIGEATMDQLAEWLAARAS